MYRIGSRAGLILNRRVRTEIVSAFIHNRNMTLAILKHTKSVENLLVESMIAAHLHGRLRTLFIVAPKIGLLTRAMGPYDAAVKFVQTRLELSEFELDNLRSMYSEAAAQITRGYEAAVGLEVLESTDVIVREGMHVRQGVGYLRQRLDAVGLGPENNSLLETWVRTQTAMAYGAGRWNTLQEPEVQNVLWGFEYFTVGDERVRPSHLAMEGTRLPKDDSFWMANWPPNGFQCRCEVLEVFIDQKLTEKRPADIQIIDGIEVSPVADVGFDFNPGIVFGDMLKVT